MEGIIDDRLLKITPTRGDAVIAKTHCSDRLLEGIFQGFAIRNEVKCHDFFSCYAILRKTLHHPFI